MSQTVTGKMGFSYSVTETLVYGAASANNFASNPITLASGANTTLTLSNLTDDLGRNFSMAGGVRMLIVQVLSRTAGDYLTLTPGATHGWTGFLSGTTPALKIYDAFAIAVGMTDTYAVTANTNDQVTITNAGSNPITFGIGIGGCDS